MLVDKALAILSVVDDFCKQLLKEQNKKLIGGSPFYSVKDSSKGFCLSEAMTVLLLFQLSGSRSFKAFYRNHAKEKYFLSLFPKLPSYSRLVEIQGKVLIPMCLFGKWLAKCSDGVAFIDSTPIKVCHNKRISMHKVFKGLAKRGKSTMGWFYGFKLHITISQNAEILDFHITTGTVDDRKVVDKICKNLYGKVFGDKGYICQRLFKRMLSQGVQLITPLRKNMKPKAINIKDSKLLSKRSLVESVFNVLKNSMHAEHTRHRSVRNFMTNIVSAICAYGLRFHNPMLRLP